MASSTTIPNTSKNAKVDNRFSDTSLAGKSANAPKKLTPIPTVTQSATFGSRVRINTRKTKSKPRIDDSAISSIRFSNTSALSDHSSRFTPTGSVGCVRLIHFFTA